MKITTEDNVKQFILYRINAIYIGFDDNVEVKLDQISDWDFDFDKIELSTIEFTNVSNDVELESHFVGNKLNKIIYIHIDALGLLPERDEECRVFYDIPCNMYIRRLKMNGDMSDCGGMLVELEGSLK